ncbi:MAG: homoserine O-succinyltransferase [Clostridia bacterium]|nr:homoserine O-succinyltransferase [Clostridia bacterium]
MPVRISKDLPARKFLEKENIFVMTYERAESQEIRPLKVAILNLMPNKIDTETQLLRLIGNTPLQVEVVFLTTASYTSKHTPETHLKSFYKTFDEIVASGDKFDGLIVTGAPVEKLDFLEVAYWSELEKIMEWASKNVYSAMYICWAAQAAMYYYYGVNKTLKNEKIFGVFRHEVSHRTNPIVRGFDDYFYAPHSRYTDIEPSQIRKLKDVTVLAESKEAGVYLASSKDLRKVFVFGHGEYDAETLKNEYERDRAKGLNTALPKNYFENDDPNANHPLLWRAHESLLISNWLNYCVYQATPYDIDQIG